MEPLDLRPKEKQSLEEVNKAINKIIIRPMQQQS